MSIHHISLEKWLEYVKGNLNEQTRVLYEEHLYNCDQCLELYLTAIEMEEKHLPYIQNEDHFTNMIMEKVKIEHEDEEPIEQNVDHTALTSKQKFYQSAIFHYVVAAAMTFLFMSTGVFSQVIHYVNALEEKNERSIVEVIMNQSFSLLNTLDKDNKEGGKK